MLKGVKIIKYDRELLSNFVYKGTDKRFNVLVDVRRVVDSYAQRGESYMAIIDGKVEAIGGITRIFSGVGFVWLLLNPKAYRYIKSIYRTIRFMVDKAMNEGGFWRLQTECSLIDKNIRLLEHLGFKKEAVMRKAGIDGKDMLLYAKVKEE